jgi:hypothetical protein
MRPTLLTPRGELTDELLTDVVGLVTGDVPPQSQIARWTHLERVLAYDWAIREHLHAGENPTRRRDRPSFTQPAGGT